MLDKIKDLVFSIPSKAKALWQNEPRVVYAALIGFAVGFFIAW